MKCTTNGNDNLLGWDSAAGSSCGAGALSYLRSLAPDVVATLHATVMRNRLRYHMPRGPAEYAQGDAIDGIVRRVAEHFSSGGHRLPPLPLVNR